MVVVNVAEPLYVLMTVVVEYPEVGDCGLEVPLEAAEPVPVDGIVVKRELEELPKELLGD